MGRTLMALVAMAGLSACDNVIYDYEENCDPIIDVEDPNPAPEPGYIRIYVRSNPGSAGQSAVHEVNNKSNANSTEEGAYVSIDIKENSPYTLTATETHDGYIFIGWHDDTNNGDLTPGRSFVENLKSDVSTRYTAVFQKIEEGDVPKPGYVRIYVRTNPGSGGLSAVSSDVDVNNSNETEEGLYVSIDIEENTPYTLTATESNPAYQFVKWHDDTNNGDLTIGKDKITGLKSEGNNRYTAIFEPKAEEPEPLQQGYYVKYIFEKNMQFVDAFPTKVTSVSLYVFDNNGNFVKKYQENGDALKDSDYLMELTDLPAGTYEFVAWCGLHNNSGHFTVASGVSTNDDAICTMSTDNNSQQSKNLNALFHGRTENATYVAKTTEKQIKEVYLTKNTNNINITLQHKEGLEFNKNRFQVTMSDQNNVMRHDNEMHSTVKTVTYTPYHTVYGSTRSRGTRADGDETTGNYLQVELSTARLMTTNNPVIQVVDTENNNNVVFSIPVVKWATQLRSAQSKTQVPDDQEYLDREDSYNMMLWLDSKDNLGWFGAQVNINDWHVIDDSSSLK